CVCADQHLLTGAPEESRWVSVIISDNGPGIPPEVFQTSVKPLTEIDNYLSGDGSSPKMGLRTAARAMEICGGALAFDNDKASTFTLTFPKSPPTPETHGEDSGADRSDAAA
ncbi:MAG: ATP-binding protein, partial [Pseudomonadota bacterium]